MRLSRKATCRRYSERWLLIIEWREADNFIYADGNPYVGPSAVLQGVFLRLAIVGWLRRQPGTIFRCRRGRHCHGPLYRDPKDTGKTINAQFVHCWTVENDKATHFQLYADTLQVARAAGA